MGFSRPRERLFKPSLSRCFLLWVVIAAWATPALAGGGPENVLLVVNARSWASQTVANHYIRLRKIPSSNVLYVNWNETIEQVDAEIFSRELLGPALQAIEQRKLSDHIDYLVYSSDLPWSVDARKEVGNRPLPQQLAPVASVNGATYLWQMFLTRNLNFVQLNSNWYFRPEASGKTIARSHGFRSWYGWGPQGELLEAGGQRYLLSTMLAVTSGRGNSVPQVIDYLQRSVEADGTFPKGTIYYAKNNDVRSTTRHDAFPAAIEALEELGVAAKIIAGTTPIGRPDVQGAMMGTATFSWGGSKSSILPGAICEHLTSTGGNMAQNAGQTCISDFLRYGASGTSGAVTEPFAIQAKFPVPAIHVHYARGCSLAEAFYQSVYGPYQLLILGDPLCQPWAKIPQVSVGGVLPGTTVSGVLTLVPTATVQPGAVVDRFELFVDGLAVGSCPRGETFTIDTTFLTDGYHEIRVVATTADSIESQGRQIVPLLVNNRGRQIDFVAPADRRIRWDQPLKLSVRCPGSVGIVVLQDSNRVLGKINGAQGDLIVDPQSLGSGPVSLRAIALGPAGPLSNISSAPVDFEVIPSAAMPGIAVDEGVLLSGGLELVLDDGKKIPVADTSPNGWLEAAGVKAGDEFTLNGLFDTKEDVYQFHVRHEGKFSLEVDGKLIHEADEKEPQRKYIPLSLGQGRHRLQIRGVAANPPRLEMRFGNEGVRHFSDTIFKHEL